MFGFGGADVNGILKGQKRVSQIVYTLAPSRPGSHVFSDVTLPDGTIIRRVDEAVHQKALDNVNRRFREIINAD